MSQFTEQDRLHIANILRREKELSLGRLANLNLENPVPGAKKAFDRLYQMHCDKVTAIDKALEAIIDLTNQGAR